MYYGMANMVHRATFALDEVTVTRIRRLATAWKVSQAEVIRRAVAATDVATNPDPLAMLESLHQSGSGLSTAKAESYLTAVREARSEWRGT